MTSTGRSHALVLFTLGLALASPTMAQHSVIAAEVEVWPGLPRRPLRVRYEGLGTFPLEYDARRCALPRGAFQDQLETRALVSLRAVEAGIADEILPFELFATAVDIECAGRSHSAFAMYERARDAAATQIAACRERCENLVALWGNAQLGMGATAGAQQDWETAIALFSTVVDDPRLTAATRADVLVQLASSYELLHRFREARAAHERLASEATEPALRRSSAYRAAILLIREGDDRAAMRALHRFIADNDEPEALELRAHASWEVWRILLRLGRTAEARRVRATLSELASTPVEMRRGGGRLVAEAGLSIVAERVDTLERDLRIALARSLRTATSLEDVHRGIRSAEAHVREIVHALWTVAVNPSIRAPAFAEQARAFDALSQALVSPRALSPNLDPGQVRAALETAQFIAHCGALRAHTQAVEQSVYSGEPVVEQAHARILAEDLEVLDRCLFEGRDTFFPLIETARRARRRARPGHLLIEPMHATPALDRTE